MNLSWLILQKLAIENIVTETRTSLIQRCPCFFVRFMVYGWKNLDYNEPLAQVC